MRPAPTRAWRGVSAHDRQLARRERLIAAGLEVIGTRGWSQTTVRAVCETAGLTERYFYECFTDREAVLVAVFEHVAARCTQTVLEAFMAAPDGARHKVRAPLAAALSLVTEDPRMGRVLLLEAGGNERLQRLRDDLAFTSAALLAEVATAYFGRAVDLDETEVMLTALAVVGAQTQLATAYLAGRLDVSLDRLIDLLVELHLASLRIPSAAAGAKRGDSR
jgi:AcrR family transcriptional regulator